MAALLEISAGAGVAELALVGETVAKVEVPLVAVVWAELLSLVAEVPVAEEVADDTVELSAKTPPFFVVWDGLAATAAWFFNGPAQ